MFAKLINLFHSKGYHLFKTRYNNSWGYYAIEYKYISNSKFDMVNAVFISGSLVGCKDSVILL